MSEINGRIAQIIVETGLSKTEFAKKINVSQQFVSKLTKDGIPSDRTIVDICREFNVNESWLKTGKGEMLRQVSDSEEIEQIFSALEISDDRLFWLIKRIIRAYWRLSDNEKAAVKKMLDNLLEESASSPAIKPQSHRHPVQEMTREKLHAELDRQLDLERGAETSPAFSNNTSEKIS